MLLIVNLNICHFVFKMCSYFFFPAKRTPFYIRFNSDSYEWPDEAKKADVGFKLQYTQSGGC